MWLQGACCWPAGTHPLVSASAVVHICVLPMAVLSAGQDASILLHTSTHYMCKHRASACLVAQTHATNALRAACVLWNCVCVCVACVLNCEGLELPGHEK